MTEPQPSMAEIERASIRDLLIELDRVEKARQDDDCLRLRSRERMLTAELRRRRQHLASAPTPTAEQSAAPVDRATVAPDQASVAERRWGI